MIAEENVVVRLKQTLQRARAEGFRVRMEVLDDEQASWCVIAGKPTLFVDLSQTAAEQLQQVEETLAAYMSEQHAEISEAGALCPKTDPNHSQVVADSSKRAA